MDAMEFFKVATTLGPIVALLTLGLGLTLHNGVVSPAGAPGLWQLSGNLSRTLLMLGACLIGLAGLQRLAGFPAALLL